jgi:hypothetical protein
MTSKDGNTLDDGREGPLGTCVVEGLESVTMYRYCSNKHNETCKYVTRTLRVLTPSDSDGLLNHHLFCLPRGGEGLDRSQRHLTNFIAPPYMHAKVLFRDIFLCPSNVNNNERLSMSTEVALSSRKFHLGSTRIKKILACMFANRAQGKFWRACSPTGRKESPTGRKENFGVHVRQPGRSVAYYGDPDSAQRHAKP